MSQTKDTILKIRVFAKINLSLRILGRLEGGYHSLETIFQNISLSDHLTLRTTPGAVDVHSDDPSVPNGPENIAYRVAVACLQMLDIRDRGLEINIEKGIPVGSGLGGGSADAAGTIIACERLFGPLPGGDTALYALAASIGADVPFLLSGGRALAWGIGERMLRLPVSKPTSLLLVLPNLSVSTLWAYRALDNSQAEGISTETMDVNSGPLKWEELIGPLGPVEGIVNDFEPVIFAHHPELRDIKHRLIEAGAKVALLSGSGSGIFGLFEDKKKRDAAKTALESPEDYRLISANFLDRAFDILE
ncbi:MAG TPA: 4-(cytidine 5'-diphospho)-2-C-methyl-D-erythritol kinase [archaeon]|nr:4-(cytidine 5'-diphospho)-2-C-methyl-D-erythritol kinase [archaeon]